MEAIDLIKNERVKKWRIELHATSMRISSNRIVEVITTPIQSSQLRHGGYGLTEN